jgi:hypothetical protein
MQANIRITCLYLALCNLLLIATSPAYNHQLQRLGSVCTSRLAQLSEYAVAGRYVRSTRSLFVKAPETMQMLQPRLAGALFGWPTLLAAAT